MHTQGALQHAFPGALWGPGRGLLPRLGAQSRLRPGEPWDALPLAVSIPIVISSLLLHPPPSHGSCRPPEINVIIAVCACLHREWVHSPPPVRQVPRGAHFLRCQDWSPLSAPCAGGLPPPAAFSVCHHPHQAHVCVSVSLRESAGEKNGEQPACQSGGLAGSCGRRIGALNKRTVPQRRAPPCNA